MYIMFGKISGLPSAHFRISIYQQRILFLYIEKFIKIIRLYRCRSYRLQLCTKCNIYTSRSWLGWQIRGRFKKRRCRLQNWEIPIYGKFQSKNESRNRWFC